MEFFDKLGKKATEAYKVTADKTSKIAKETKLKFKIGDLRSKVDELYGEIGKKVYEQHTREEDYSIKDDLEELCTKIDTLSDEIDSSLKECLKLKDKKQCPKCFTEIEKNDKFCPKCGEKQVDEKPDEVEILEGLENSEVTEENKAEEEIVEEELKKDIEEKESKSNLQETIIIESDPNIKPDENNQDIKMEGQDSLDD